MRSIIFTLVFIVAFISANGQFTITPVNGIAGTYTEGLSYPKISSGIARIDAKIDSLLQAEILFNETIVTDPKKIFDNTAYISEPDSLAKSGHTNISYEVLLNTAQVLSIKFDLESMGAYPENYKRYFCFDAQTGARLSERDLFTDAGIKYLQTLLKDVRGRRIKEYFSGEIAITEDSAFARERYEECNGDAGLREFVIQQKQILFYKEFCFPHAWRSFDIVLDVEIQDAMLKKYLTPRGRKLLQF